MENIKFYLSEIQDDISPDLMSSLENCDTLEEVEKLEEIYACKELNWLIMMLLRDHSRKLQGELFVYLN